MTRFHARFTVSIALIIFSLLLTGCARDRETPPTPTTIPSNGATGNIAATATLAGSNPTTVAIQDTATPTVTSVPPGQVAPTSTPVPVLSSESAAVEVTAVTSLPNPQGSTTSTASDSTASTAAGQGESGIHIVQLGENLYRISLRYDVSMQELTRLNNIANPDMIYVGQRLQIPGLASNDGSFYIVEPGDTLISIALEHNTSVSALVAANRLANSDFIYVGQRLVIP